MKKQATCLLLMTLFSTGCAYTPPEVEASTSLVPVQMANNHPTSIVFADNEMILGNNLTINEQIYQVSKRYFSALGHPCAELSAPSQEKLLACKVTQGWVLQNSLSTSTVWSAK